MPNITKLKLTHFKRFKQLEISFNPLINTIIGDNEAGKSTIIQAIELVANGSRHKVESASIESLLNKECVAEFLNGAKTIENLPRLHAELYLSDEGNPDLVGKNNSDKANVPGLQMICEPNLELASEINQILAEDSDNFPFEYYVVRFATFSGEAYSGYRRFLKSLTIDSAQINSEYANKEYIKTVYDSTADHPTRIQLKNEYRQQKVEFQNNNLQAINNTLGDYDFGELTAA